MDHKDDNKRNQESPEVNSAEISSSSSSSPSSSTDLKSCEICRTTKTPLWRGGPSGPKSLCNACGIKYRKKRREFLGLNNTGGEEKDSSGSGKKENKNVMRLLGFATDLFLQQRSILKLKRRRRLAEEEEAAVLLMALSSGFLYA